VGLQVAQVLGHFDSGNLALDASRKWDF